MNISVYTRHEADCPKRKDRYWKKCNCPNWLYYNRQSRGYSVSRGSHVTLDYTGRPSPGRPEHTPAVANAVWDLQRECLGLLRAVGGPSAECFRFPRIGAPALQI